MYNPCRGGIIKLKFLRKNSRALVVKVWLLVKWVIKLKTFQKWFGVQSLELLTFGISWFHVKTLFSKKMVTIAEDT